MSKKSSRYTEEFKVQIVTLINNGKSPNDVVKEYGIARSTVHKWTTDFNNTGSFKAKENKTEEEKEFGKLIKDNQRLKMENDILKQAALIMGRK